MVGLQFNIVKVGYVNIIKAIAYCSIIVITISACDKSRADKYEESIMPVAETKPIEEKPPADEQLGRILGVAADGVLLLDAPSTSGAKIINQKATAAIGETQYISIDTSCKVKIIERKNGWVKLQVVDPDWLMDSHIGWAKINVIEGFSPRVTVADDSYHIVKTINNGSIDNIYVVYTGSETTIDIARALVRKIRENTGSSNIYVFDDEKVIPLFNIYPLKNADYIRVADNFICMSSFDLPLSVAWYPYQDFQYKEYGGNNWKKEPIE